MAARTELPRNNSAVRPIEGRRVVASALWSAAGDALGWQSELTDERGLRFRTGNNRVHGMVEWRRRIGGRYGPTVSLPAGTYSDDTQLRLAVGRSIRGTGEFDPEAFAKIELPVWQSYSLGAGPGTLAAASNLAKNGVSWFSNFYEGKDHKSYFLGGGNGAAMRIQPHVWSNNPEAPLTFLPGVLRDAVITHGHPRGFCGAAFHALCLARALTGHRVPDPDEWLLLAKAMNQICSVVEEDEQ
jgi:ADP-ribosylglycohydrolase